MNGVTAAIALTLLGISAAASDIAPGERRSGLEFQGEETRALQQDPFANPGRLWVATGEELWRTEHDGGPACAGCHGEARSSMHGVATRYPRIDSSSGRLLNLEGRINQCRTDRQGALEWRYESDELLGMTAYVASQSRGLPLAVDVSGSAASWYEAGKALYETRQGQLNIACKHCHSDHYGQLLRGDTLSQGHSNGYPVYRLEWQSLGSLHRRLRACSSGVRATMYDYGSPEYLSLELYLAWRARGLPLETPGVRR